MQKSDKKLIAKFVGMTIGCACFEGITKRQKGITLIALIITIIVMLILVGVTISVALNGGLFDVAGKATSDTEKHSIYDQILGVMKLTDNGTINVEETHSNAETVLGNKGMIVSQLGADGKFTVTGKRGTYTYKITETEIEIAGEDTGSTRVPFANYIEDGNNYYIYRNNDSSSYEVVTISREESKLYLYSVSDEEVSLKDWSECEIAVKEEAIQEFGYSSEILEQIMGVTFDKVDSEVFVSNGKDADLLSVFKSNYTEMMVFGTLYTLDTTYEFPNQ